MSRQTTELRGLFDDVLRHRMALIEAENNVAVSLGCRLAWVVAADDLRTASDPAAVGAALDRAECVARWLVDETQGSLVELEERLAPRFEQWLAAERPGQPSASRRALAQRMAKVGPFRELRAVTFGETPTYAAMSSMLAFVEPVGESAIAHAGSLFNRAMAALFPGPMQDRSALPDGRQVMNDTIPSRA